MPTSEAAIAALQLLAANGDMPAFRLVISNANIGPASGMFINPVSVPAAPTYASVCSTSDDNLVDDWIFIHLQYLRAKDTPTKPPAVTIGASGPRLKPDIEVRQHSNMTGSKCFLAEGNLLMSAPPLLSSFVDNI